MDLFKRYPEMDLVSVSCSDPSLMLTAPIPSEEMLSYGVCQSRKGWSSMEIPGVDYRLPVV